MTFATVMGAAHVCIKCGSTTFNEEEIVWHNENGEVGWVCESFANKTCLSLNKKKQENNLKKKSWKTVFKSSIYQEADDHRQLLLIQGKEAKVRKYGGKQNKPIRFEVKVVQ